MCGAGAEVSTRRCNNYRPTQLSFVSTGSLSPGEIAAPPRGILNRQKNTRVLMGDVEDIDPVSKRVLLADGASFEYDSLIVATGSQSSYYGHDDWPLFRRTNSAGFAQNL